MRPFAKNQRTIAQNLRRALLLIGLLLPLTGMAGCPPTEQKCEGENCRNSDGDSGSDY